MATKPVSESVLVWCVVCKDWIPAWRETTYCPRCGNDEIEHDDD